MVMVRIPSRLEIAMICLIRLHQCQDVISQLAPVKKTRQFEKGDSSLGTGLPFTRRRLKTIHVNVPRKDVLQNFMCRGFEAKILSLHNKSGWFAG